MATAFSDRSVRSRDAEKAEASEGKKLLSHRWGLVGDGGGRKRGIEKAIGEKYRVRKGNEPRRGEASGSPSRRSGREPGLSRAEASRSKVSLQCRAKRGELRRGETNRTEPSDVDTRALLGH